MRGPRLAAVATLVVAGLAGLCASRAAAAWSPADTRDRTGIVYRYYAPYGYRFQPLLSFAQLNRVVSAHDVPAARRLASALLARGVRRGNGLYWEYDFPYGGPAGWTSGFAEAVAAQAFARTAKLLDDDSFLPAAASSVRALTSSLLMPLGGGLWVREYGFSSTAILNAQLQSILSLESYARIAETDSSKQLAGRLYVAARSLLTRFDTGCWSRYSLGGGAASLHYHAYHVELLRQLAAAHPGDSRWRRTYLDWSSCLTQ